VLEGLCGEDSVAELCRREGINQNLYYRWSTDFLDAGNKRLSGGSMSSSLKEPISSNEVTISGSPTV